MSRGLTTALVIAVLATVLRAQFVFFPPGDHADELIVAALAERAALTGTLTANWQDFPDVGWSRATYQFSPYTLAENALAFASYRLFGWPESLFDHVRFARWVSVVAGGLAVLTCFFAAKAWFGAVGTALLAESLLALAFLHVQDSCYARVEAFLSLWVLLTFRAAASAMDRPTNRRRFWVGAAIGVTIAVKYNAAPIALLAAPILSRGAATLVGGLVVGFFVATPEALLAPSPLVEGVRYEAAHYAEGHVPHQALDPGDGNLKFWSNYLARLGFGWTPTLAAAAFVFIGVRRPGRERLLAVYLVVSMIGMIAPTVRFERNAEILLGPACLAAAWVIARWWTAARTSSLRPVVRAALVAAVAGNLVQHSLALVDFRQQQKRSKSPLRMIPEAARRVDYLGQAISNPPPENWREYEVLLLSGYSDAFSQRGLREWRERLKGWKVEMYAADWYRAGYPFSTVETYHGPGFILRATRQARSSPP